MDGYRQEARNKLQPGDLVVLVGTKGERTAGDEQGRLLGIMEPTTESVLSLDFDLPTRPEHFDDAENYRWPYALLNRSAWRILDRQPLEAVSDRPFYIDAAVRLVEVTDAEAAKVMALRREPAELLQPSVRARARLEGTAAARRMTAPPPTTTRRGVMHMRRAPAFTYAMRVEGATPMSFKLGWAFDFKLRAEQFNQASMPELGGLRYKPVLNHFWDTARQAYCMEQRLLRHFSSHRHAANFEIVHGILFAELESAWVKFSTSLKG
jgi:hypothetical protein